MIIEDTKQLFEIHICEDGYLAIRNNNPSFCLHGKTIAEVSQKAERAFNSYKDYLKFN